MSSFLRRAAQLLTATTIAACASGGMRRTASDEAADRAALLRLHAEQRTAHLEHRADLLVAGQADTLWNVSGGRISANPRERARASFQAYFDASTFAAWDDVTPPRIRISADGRMAYVIVDKRVHVTITPSRGGAPVVQRVHYAWLSVYEKIDGRWQMTAIASTERPDST
ncbi:MAG TPA: nuclear transport factor 2 family protein [Gemmatimonadaceae bacterium]|nr:nuclear transport factor 2 family protein [Gemmatimonadaceae bacterium]